MTIHDPGKFDMRCHSPTSSDGAFATVGGVCGEPEVAEEDLSAFCSSLELLDSPYTCEEVSVI